MFPPPKKHLGQHFLVDDMVAQRIATALEPTAHCEAVIEVGAGRGAITKHLASREGAPLYLVEVDKALLPGLRKAFPMLADRLIEADFLKMVWPWEGKVAVIGNFPYNISSQIFFALLQRRHQVDCVVGMVQQEVAQRLSSPPGSRKYGLLSVLLQAYYHVTYLFHVPPTACSPPPKMMSGVVRMVRNSTAALPCDERVFVQVVKTAFGQRRKMLRNALGCLGKGVGTLPAELLNKRAEQLSVADFVAITNALAC